jgi:hypothetical protein
MAFGAVFDAGLFQPQPVDVRLAARGDEQVRALDILGPAILGDRHRNAARAAADPFDGNALADIDALGQHPAAHHVGGLRVVAAQQAEHLQYRHPAAQLPVRLRHLHPDRTAADDDQMVRLQLQIEDGFVGQHRYARDARDRRNRGGGSRRHHEAPGPDVHAAGLHLARSGETPGFPDHPDAHPFEAGLRIHRGDALDNALHVALYRGKVDLWLHGRNSEPSGVAHVLGRVGRRQQGLGGHTAVIQAVAAHLAFFDQHDLRAHLRSARRDRQPARPRADNAKIRLDGIRHVRVRPRSLLLPVQ